MGELEDKRKKQIEEKGYYSDQFGTNYSGTIDCKLNTEIYKKAIKKFGSYKQTLKTIEELSELIQAIITFNISECINVDIDDEMYFIYEEIADVEIMLEQLKLIFDCYDTVNTIKKQKLERLEKLINA